MNKIRIAIDGPSGAGKSTVARKVAELLGIDYVDTGAMYRAVSYKLLMSGAALSDTDRVRTVLEETDIDFVDGDVLLDGTVVSDKIRTQEIAQLASATSALPEVREKLVALQRKMGEMKSIVMDGRDIGTNVMPDAEYKFFLTAAPEERARRRWIELKEKGEQVPFDQILAEIIERDRSDSTRSLNPLRKAADAVEIDSTGKDAEETTREVLSYIR